MTLTLKAIPNSIAWTGRCGVNVGLPMNSWGFTATPGHVYLTDPWLGTFTALWSTANLQYIRNAGFDHIRLMFDQGTFCTELAANGNVANARFDYYWNSVKAAIDKILANGLKVMYDGSHGSNGTNGIYDGVWYMDNLLAGTGDSHYITWKAMWVELATRIAANYSPSDVAIELLNEPNGTNQAGWNATIAPNLYAAVRAAAPNHTIAVGGSSFNGISQIVNLVPANFGANTLYVFHGYIPSVATLQSDVNWPWVYHLEWPPNPSLQAANIAAMTANINASSTSDKATEITNTTADINSYYSTPMNAAYIATQFDTVSTWCTNNNVPPDAIWVGEFGVPQDYTPGSLHGGTLDVRSRLCNAIINAANARGFRWSIFDMTYSDFRLTDDTASQWAGIGAFYPQLLSYIRPPKPRVSLARTETSADWADYKGSVSNGFWYENDVWGKGSFVNGVDYTQKCAALDSSFPVGAILSWSWPDTTGGQWAYGYPEITYGRRPGGNNPFSYSGVWPQQISANTTLSVTYDIALAGNTNSFSTLIDIFITSIANPSDLTTLVAEVSFVPSNNYNAAPSGTLHQFTNTGGTSYYAKVYNNGASPCPQISVEPCTSDGSAAVNILSGTIDLKEILTYMIAQGWFTSSAYIQGVQFGAEPQSPNAYNSTPHTGSMTFNALSVTWT